MCSHCRSFAPDFRIPHTEDLCPFRLSRYCTHCAIYGHLTAMCPVAPASVYVQPVYLEQLIPAADRREFRITSQTPLQEEKTNGGAPAEQALLEIKNNDQVILAYLHARSIRIPRKVTKRQVLEDYATQQGLRVVYLA